MDPGVQASDMRLNLVSNSSMPSQVFLGRETGWLHIVWLHHPHNTNISIGNNTDARLETSKVNSLNHPKELYKYQW